MITLVGMFAKARCYVVQTRSDVTPADRRRNRRDPEAGWTHCAQFNYDGKLVVKDQALNRAELFETDKAHLYDDHQFRVVNMTVKQAHKAKAAKYQPDGDLKRLKPEFDYDKKCSRRISIPCPASSRRRGSPEKLGTTALATPETNHNDTNTRDYQRLRRAMAYYAFAANL